MKDVFNGYEGEVKITLIFENGGVKEYSVYEGEYECATYLMTVMEKYDYGDIV